MRKIGLLIGLFAFCLFSCSHSVSESGCREINQIPQIFPDINEVTIPCNIAPLNFSIAEEGKDFRVKIYSQNNKPFWISSDDGIIKFSERKWKKLLNECKGSDFHLDVFVKDQSKQWNKYQTLNITVSADEIDSHLAYRIINVGYMLYKKLGLYQRDLTSFKETPIMLNRNTDWNCMNCHSFWKNDPDRMMFHMRADNAGTIIIDGKSIKKIATKTPKTMSAGVYPSWHPDGKHIAFSVDLTYQLYHGIEKKSEVFDKASDIVVYNVETNTITTSPKVSSKSREVLPCWSPDGKYIYYCSTYPVSDSISWDKVRYDLMRIPYDVNTNTWGNVDTILLGKDFKGSITFPKVSPDGKWLVFTSADHGYFTIYNDLSDLYLLNLETKEVSAFPYNSSEVDSYHSWSSNGKWLVFSSKRIDGLCTRPYFSHFDSNGKFSKPFVLPQEDPLFYQTFKDNYNVPELVKGAVNVNKPQLLKVARGKALPANFDTNVDIDALSGATKIEKPIN
ncbi:MAG TPA: hypothetical protein PKH79_00830 [Prolixibacteraceae bacterium]|nr:hypothetical protein [Prolixibacteraceae bacterium]